MELLDKLEKTVLGWFKNLPHLPEGARKWLAENVWWMAIIGLVSGVIAIIVVLFSTLLGTAATAYVLPAFAMWQLINGIVTLVILGLNVALLAMAIKPLQARQKKGWVLLYILLLISVLYAVVSAVLTLNPFVFILQILFSGIGIAIAGYFLFEIHGQFAHVHKSNGVKTETKKKAL